MAWRHVTSRENALYQNPEWLFYLIMDKAGIPSTNQNSEQMCLRHLARENAYKQLTIAFVWSFTSDW